MKHTFSLNALSEVLERDRRTITKALRHIEPDTYEGKGAKKQGRWKMQTAIDALAALEPKRQQHNTGDGPFEAVLDAAQSDFERALDVMEKLPTLEQRRQRSIEIADLVDHFVDLMKQRGEADNLHPQHIELLGQTIYRLMIMNFAEPCGWTQQEVWHHVVCRHDAEEKAA